MLNLKQNKEVQLDLQRFESFIFLSLLLSLLPGEMLEEKLAHRFSRSGICMTKTIMFLWSKRACKNLRRFSFKLLKPFCVSSEQGFTNVDLKISLYVSVHTKTIP